MIQVNISSRHSKILNRQPIQFSDAKNKHERLGKGDNYSFDASIDKNGRAYDVKIPAERKAFYNLNSTAGPIYVLANTKNTTGKWETQNEIAEAKFGWEQIQNEYDKQYPLIGKYTEPDVEEPQICLDTSYVITNEEEASSRFQAGDLVDGGKTRWQDSIMILPSPDSVPVFYQNFLDGPNGEPSRVLVRNMDGSYSDIPNQAWRRHG
mgnify:FL=1